MSLCGMGQISLCGEVVCRHMVWGVLGLVHEAWGNLQEVACMYSPPLDHC